MRKERSNKDTQAMMFNMAKGLYMTTTHTGRIQGSSHPALLEIQTKLLLGCLNTAWTAANLTQESFKTSPTFIASTEC